MSRPTQLMVHAFLALVLFSLIMDLVWAVSRVMSLLAGIAIVVLYLRWLVKSMTKSELSLGEHSEDD